MDSLLTVFQVGRLHTKQPSWRKHLSSLLGLFWVGKPHVKKAGLPALLFLGISYNNSAMVAFTPERTWWVNTSVRTWWMFREVEYCVSVRNVWFPIHHLELIEQKKAYADMEIFQGTGKNPTPIQSLPYSLLVFYWSFIDCSMPPFCKFLVPFSLFEMRFLYYAWTETEVKYKYKQFLPSGYFPRCAFITVHILSLICWFGL